MVGSKQSKNNKEDKSPATLKEALNKLVEQNEVLVQQKKQKKFFMPWSGRLGRAAVKKGYVTIIYIQENKEIKFFKTQISEGTIIAEGSPYLALAPYMMTYKGKPIMIIPSWNIEPFNPSENVDQANREKTLTLGWRHCFNRMKNEVIQTKKKMNMGLIIGGLAVVGIVLFMMQKGGFKLF